MDSLPAELPGKSRRKEGKGSPWGAGTAGEGSLARRSLYLGDGRRERGSAEESGRGGEWRGRRGPDHRGPYMIRMGVLF